MADRVKIDIETEGDPKGAREVSNSLNEIEKSSEKANKAVKKHSDESAKSSDKLADAQDALSSRFAEARAKIEEAQKTLGDVSKDAADTLETDTVPALEKAERAAERTGDAMDKTAKPGFDKAGDSAKKAGGNVEGLKGRLDRLQGAVEWIRGGIIVAGVMAIVNAFREWGEELKAIKDRADESLPPIQRSLINVKEAQEDLIDPSDRYTRSLSASLSEAEKLRDAIQQQLEDTEALEAARTRLALAEVDAQVRAGDMTPEAGASRRAEIQGEAERQSFARQVDAANERLRIKNEELAAAERLAAEQARAATEAQRRLEEVASFRGDREAASVIAPDANADVDAMTKSRLELEKIRSELENARLTLSDGLGALEENLFEGLVNPLIPLAAILKERSATVAEIEDLDNQIKKATEAEEVARDSRTKAIDDEKRATLANARAKEEAAALAVDEVARLRDEAAAAQQDLTRKSSGVEREIFETNQAATAAANAPAPTAPGSPGGLPPAADPNGIAVAMAGLPSNAQTQEMLQLMQGGLVASEMQRMSELVKAFAISVRDEGLLVRLQVADLQAELDRAKEALKDLQTR